MISQWRPVVNQDQSVQLLLTARLLIDLRQGSKEGIYASSAASCTLNGDLETSLSKQTCALSTLRFEHEHNGEDISGHTLGMLCFNHTMDAAQRDIR